MTLNSCGVWFCELGAVFTPAGLRLFLQHQEDPDAAIVSPGWGKTQLLAQCKIQAVLNWGLMEEKKNKWGTSVEELPGKDDCFRCHRRVRCSHWAWRLFYEIRVSLTGEQRYEWGAKTGDETTFSFFWFVSCGPTHQRQIPSEVVAADQKLFHVRSSE